MKLPTLVRTFSAGVVVYLVMAACAAESDRSGATGHRSSGSVGSPVPPAHAEPATERCTGSYTANGVTVAFAFHDYPGATAEELATVVAVFEPPPGSGPTGFTKYTVSSAIWLRDDAVAVGCAGVSTVTFVRP